MSLHLHASILNALKAVVQFAKIILIAIDKVTAVDITCWVGVHVYTMDNWERMPHLLHLSCIPDGGIVNNLTSVIMHVLLEEGGLNHEDIASKLICFGVDGVNTFQSPKPGVTAQIREKWAPFTLGVSCVNHSINLVVETLSKT